MVENISYNKTVQDDITTTGVCKNNNKYGIKQLAKNKGLNIASYCALIDLKH